MVVPVRSSFVVNVESSLGVDRLDGCDQRVVIHTSRRTIKDRKRVETTCVGGSALRGTLSIEKRARVKVEGFWGC